MPKVLLKDVVVRIKDKVDKDNTELEFYIGGEHFDNGEIQITKKGVIKDSTIGPAFHMRFQPGDVLLMSRNPHLRKAGVVDFEGICSDVSYVCRTKDENVLMQRFIPFIFQTDHFWKFAEENKKGSTNFFLNWSDFEKYEFDLPVIEEQRKLCEMMWAFEDTKTAYKQLLQKTDDLVKSQFIEMFGDPYTNPKGWEIGTIEDVMIGKASNGFFAKPADYSSDGNAGIICVGDVVNRKYSNVTGLRRANADDKQFQKFKVQYGDMLFCRSSLVKEGIAKASIVPAECDEDILFECHVIRVRLDIDRVVPEFMQAFTITDYFRTQMMDKSKTATMTTIGQKDVISGGIYIPDMELQKQFAEFAEQSDKSKFELKQAIADIDNLMKTFMTQNREKEE